MNRFISVVLVLAAALLTMGCSAARPIAMEPAAVLRHDVFTCKSLSADNHWIDVTDEFIPEEDPRVVVVARLDKEDLDKVVIYELVNPLNTIVLTERRMYPRSETLGIYFEMQQLMERGGEGRWIANVYSDDSTVGQAVFYVGEKPDEIDEWDDRFFVIGEESLTALEETPVFMDEEDRYSNYIREVAPDAPLNSAPASSFENALRGINLTP